ncbi:hypothetical protein B0J12DRAFT_714941 [Macrophomina phaseolina]|uniref:AB hydrolase-1 domain-containing protein n=1 Tax=Macrophomina phaseolina TaxID=35725 RepID=A0ABQ8FPW5_9PEZI|nr:hypothetical protein B0J12DRAFT_714941 [Macrophomina phaseolina]
MAMSKPTFVFAPGAWHSSECFYLGFERLRARCYATESICYPSYGVKTPNKTLADDVAALRAPLERLANKENEIILVAHSYGGIVAANATEGLGQKSRAEMGKKGGVIMFVYLAAFVVPKGKSMTDMFGGNGDYRTPKNPEKLFYHDVDGEPLNKALSQLKHTSSLAYPTEAHYEPWHDIPYDQVLLLAVQRVLAASLGASASAFSCDASRSPFLSMPQKVVDGLEYAVNVAQEKRMSE